MLSGTEATVDPTLIHHMHEIVPTTVGYMQLTEAFVSRDSILRLSVKLTNTTDEPVEFDYSNLRVRNGDGTLLEYEYDCPNGSNIKSNTHIDAFLLERRADIILFEVVKPNLFSAQLFKGSSLF